MSTKLAEHVSRKARVELTKLILDSGWSIGTIADEIGVTRRAIYYWLDPRETHPSNSNLDELLRLAFELDIQGTSKVLLKEVDNFRAALNECIFDSLERKDK